MDHSCSFCGDKFTWKSTLEDHIRRHTREKPFFCTKCKCGFLNKSDQCRHTRKVHERSTIERKKNYNCSLCPFATHWKDCFENHISVHTGERNFPCQHPNCKFSAKSSSGLYRHNAQRHTIERKYFCSFPKCGYRGKTKGCVRAHFKNHSESRPFICDFGGCSYRAKRSEALSNHKLGVHNGGNKPFACPVCNYRTTYKTALKRHELTHNEEKSFKCEFSGCTYACKYKFSLSRHVQYCHTKKTFKCDFPDCFWTAASRLILEGHKKCAHGERVKCPRCDYRTAYPAQMRKHFKEQHYSGLRVPCPIKGCNFQSKNQKSLNKHVHRHTGNIGCQVEGCVFINKSRSAQKRHMQLHNPNGRPFHCALCPKYFPSNSRLSVHLKSHTEEKTFKCPACNLGLASRRKLIIHVRAIHSTVFPKFGYDEMSTCDHCQMNFGCAVGLAMHTLKLKTAVVVLTRLQLKLDQ